MYDSAARAAPESEALGSATDLSNELSNELSSDLSNDLSNRREIRNASAHMSSLGGSVCDIPRRVYAKKMGTDASK